MLQFDNAKNPRADVLAAMDSGDYEKARRILNEIPQPLRESIRKTVAVITQVLL